MYSLSGTLQQYIRNIRQVCVGVFLFVSLYVCVCGVRVRYPQFEVQAESAIIHSRIHNGEGNARSVLGLSFVPCSFLREFSFRSE